MGELEAKPEILVGYCEQRANARHLHVLLVRFKVQTFAKRFQQKHEVFKEEMPECDKLIMHKWSNIKGYKLTKV